MLFVKRANSVDLDEVADDEPPHQDLHCLQIQLFLSLVRKELKYLATNVGHCYHLCYLVTIKILRTF